MEKIWKELSAYTENTITTDYCTTKIIYNMSLGQTTLIPQLQPLVPLQI